MAKEETLTIKTEYVVCRGCGKYYKAKKKQCPRCKFPTKLSDC